MAWRWDRMSRELVAGHPRPEPSGNVARRESVGVAATSKARRGVNVVTLMTKKDAVLSEPSLAAME